MADFITVLQDTPVPTILVVEESILLFITAVGQFAGEIKAPKERQRNASLTV